MYSIVFEATVFLFCLYNISLLCASTGICNILANNVIYRGTCFHYSHLKEGHNDFHGAW